MFEKIYYLFIIFLSISVMADNFLESTQRDY